MDQLRLGSTGNVAQKSIGKAEKALSKVIEHLATAQRINRASDDAAGLGVAEQLSAQARGFSMASRNVADALSALNVADGAGTQIVDMVQRQRDLALQAKNDTLNDQQRQSIDKEYQQLSQEIERTAQSTTFNTQSLVNGQGLGSGSAQVQSGANEGDVSELPVIDMSATALGITGTSVASSAQASTALSSLDNALVSLNRQRSTIGAFTNGFISASNNLAVAQNNTVAAESVIRDQDMAMGVADMVRDRLLLEGSAKAFSRFNEISANHILGLMQ